MASTIASLGNFDELPDSAHVDDRTLALLFGVTPGTIWRRARAGELPAPIRFSSRCTRWNVGAVRKVLAQKSGGLADGK